MVQGFVLTDPTIGGTFITWSIYYLTGKTDYWFWRTKRSQQLPTNPLSSQNAHGFRPNQVTSLEEMRQFCKAINSTTADDLVVGYLHPSPYTDNETMVSEAVSVSQKTIAISVPDEHNFYHYRLQARTLTPKYNDPSVLNQSWEEQHQDFLEHFFGKDLEHWKNLGLTETWDRREFLALNLRPRLNSLKITNFQTGRSSHSMVLDAREVWFMLDDCIRSIMDWLHLSIDRSRYDEWLKVYQIWRVYHYNRVRFGWYFNKIIDAIIVGQDMDLKRFDLDIMQEAIIQHELIYTHNLNFRTYGLEKFSNTQQLHNLLETNFHPIEKYA